MKETKHTKNQPNEKTEPSSNKEDVVVEALQKDIVELRKQNDEYLDNLQRERASFANYKRRIDQENAEIYDKSLGELVKPFLPVIDDLERALKHQPEDKSARQWVEGVELILQKLIKTLESKGVKAMVVNPGDTFNPNFHEAVTHEDDPNYSDGQIIESVQTGYTIKDKIIRPALVRVAK